MGSTTVPVLSHLLSDTALQPGANLLKFQPEGAEAALAMVQHPEFAAFAKGFPCLLDAQHAAQCAPPVLAGMLAAGCQLLQQGQLQACNEGMPTPQSKAAGWIDGNWFLAAPAKPKANQSASKVLALKLVQLVTADADTHEIEEVFRQDPTLSYHLLRLVNSLAFGANRKISSFSQAILMLGRQQLKRWLNLMLFAAGKDDPRSPMLLATVVVRARLMELLTRELGGDKAAQDMAFMAGMFSMLGTLFGMTLEEIFKPLQADEALSAAVLRHEGSLGQLLWAVDRAQALDTAALGSWLVAVSMPASQFSQLQWQACQWMLSVNQDSGHD